MQKGLAVLQPILGGNEADFCFQPPEVLLLEPWWRNFVYNMATVQLVHRTFFWTLAVLVPIAWWRARHTLTGNVLLAVFLLQATLGITTLLLRVPIGFGAAHQAGAVLLLGAALWHAHAEKGVRTLFSATTSDSPAAHRRAAG